MTFIEIINSLPNGFHDAILSSMNIDYSSRTLTMGLDIWMGDLSSDLEEVREKYKSARLVINDFLYCVIEPPDFDYSCDENKAIIIDAGSLPEKKINAPEQLIKNIGQDIFGIWFFLNDLNCFIYITAKSAELKWNT